MSPNVIPAAEPAQLYFRPWVRRGLAAGVDWTSVGAVATIDASITVAGVPVTPHRIKLRGPGHVIGLDAGLVIRSEPQPDTKSFEPNYFPFVEILTPDLPWRYSPTGPDGQNWNRIRPWMVLVVVRDRAGVSLTTSPSLPLPTLEVDDARAELPDLTESWAWVHAQVSTSIVGDAALASSLSSAPEAWLCRLICPRRLDPLTAYIACLVPAYRAGVDAVLDPLGADPEVEGNAWDHSTGGRVILPVYHSWRFTTGEGGDFEALVRQLKPYEVGPEVGTCPLDLSNPGGGLPQIAGATEAWVGPLVSSSLRVPAWNARQKRQFEQRLSARLAVTEDAAADPVVALPLYGGVALGVDEPADASAAWISTLNLDPAARASAGIGTAVVRRYQEALVAACWDEAPDLTLAATLVRQAALAGRVGAVLTGRLVASTDDGAFLQAAQPLLGRVQGSNGTVLKRVRGGNVPGGLLSATLRRVARPKGTLGRAVRTGMVPTAARVTTMATQGTLTFRGISQMEAPDGLCLATSEALTGEPTYDKSGVLLDGLVLTSHVIDRTVVVTSGTLASARTSANPAVAPLGATVPETARTRAALLDTLEGHVQPPNTDWLWQRYEDGLATIPVDSTPDPNEVPAAVDLAAAAGEVRAALADPLGLVATRLGARVTGLALLTEGVTGAGSATYVPHPSFAVAPAVIALDPELLLPGVGTIPSETISTLLVHAPTVEALLVGANAALAAELRWREYPTDPGATFLKSFWNASTEDIPEVSTWQKDLGKHLYASSGDDLLIFLVRGEIIRRYPDARYYLVKARWEGNIRLPVDPDEPGQPVAPEKRRDLVFTGSVDTLTRYFAFAITADEARGSSNPRDHDPGWFFAIEQAPTGPRFGLDEAGTDGGGTTTWNSLSWDDVVPSGMTLGSLSHLSVRDVLEGETRETLTWGSDAGQMAAITLQRPACGYLHASAMLPKESDHGR